MRNILINLFVFLLLPSMLLASDDSGTFRGKWWNYYQRGADRIESNDLDAAISDLEKAVSLRDADQRMARTYGMHFIDYFAHRELGIALFGKGEIERAIRELEISIASAESAKAQFYLKKALERKLSVSGVSIAPPVIEISSQLKGSVNTPDVRIKGVISAEGYVSAITVAGRPYMLDRVSRRIELDHEVTLHPGVNSIVLNVADVLGNTTRREWSITLDEDGPMFSLFDVSLRDGKYHISGEASDPSGIERIVVGAKEFISVGAKEFVLDASVDASSGMGVLLVRVYDMLGNETVAEVELDSRADGERFMQVASGGELYALFSADKTPPVFRLRESGDLPSVFIDRYYIDGEVSDDSKVGAVFINGKELQIKKGKKIFFSSAVPLKEGKNIVTIEAVDLADNRSSKNMSIRRVVPDVLKSEARMRVAVLPFEVKQKATDLTPLAYDYLTGSLVEQKRFMVIERSKLDQILMEQKLAKEKLTDPEYSIKLGKLLSAEAMLAASIKEDSKSVEVVVRVINTETSEVMAVKDVYTEDKGSVVVRDLMDALASKVALGFPLVEGIVIKAERAGELYTDLGTQSGIRKDMGVIIYRKTKEIRHPVTGKSLGWDTVTVGDGRIEDVQAEFSRGRYYGAKGDVRASDLIITK